MGLQGGGAMADMKLVAVRLGLLVALVIPAQGAQAGLSGFSTA